MTQVIEDQVQMKTKKDREKNQEKKNASTYLCTKGVTYSKYLGRISRPPNKHILTLRGKDFFRSINEVNGCITKFVLSFLSPPQVVKDQEQTNLAHKIRQKRVGLSTVNPFIVFNSVNTTYVENLFKIILKQHKVIIATNKNVPTSKHPYHSIDIRFLSIWSHILIDVMIKENSLLNRLVNIIITFFLGYCRITFDPEGRTKQHDQQ